MLYERLTGLGLPLIQSGGSLKLPIHQFCSYLAERRRGRVTNAQVIAAFTLSAEDQAELVTLWNVINAGTLTAAEVEDVLRIAEERLSPYDTVVAVRTRLGV